MRQNQNVCFGCGACRDVCPVGAITMERDAEGFVYPKIHDDLCVRCGKCDAACPEPGGTAPENGYAFLHRDRAIWEISASGGAFSAIAEAFWSEHPTGVICGAALDKNLRVRHRCVGREESVAVFHDSKYVQSDMTGVYRDILDRLDHHTDVLFSGTPCQAAALRKLAGFRENLIILDLVCNGVASPGAWEAYLRGCAETFGSDVSDYRFRNKQYPSGRGVRLSFRDGMSVTRSHAEDVFLLLYLLNLINRPSCATCPFTTPIRESDLTLGDFHGLETVDPSFSSCGASLLIPHTDKGKAMLDAIREYGKVGEYPISSCLQPRLESPAKPPMLRKLILNDFLKLPAKVFAVKYGKMLDQQHGKQ